MKVWPSIGIPAYLRNDKIMKPINVRIQYLKQIALTLLSTALS